MKIVTIVARVLLGLLFLAAGLNGLLNHSQPKDLPPGLADFLGCMQRTHFMLPLISGTQAVVGAMLVTGLFVPLALVVLAPILVNIICVHIFVAPGIGPMTPGLVATALECFLVWRYWGYFKVMFTMRAKP